MVATVVNMQNVCLKFYVTEKQRHDGVLLYEWLLGVAKRLGAPGGSAFRAIGGYGRHGRLHEERFFELAGEMAVQVEFVLDGLLADKLLDELRACNVSLPYVRHAVETGVV
jgi:PII-like signaling protein